MLAFARDAGLVPAESPIFLAEEFARDSFENVFFSVLAYRRNFGYWPSRVGALSWKFKALRYYMIGLGLGLLKNDFRFFGSADPLSSEACEKVAIASVAYDAQIVDLNQMEIVDPLHRGPDFARKRTSRMPSEFNNENGAYLKAVIQAYDSQLSEIGVPGIIAHTINSVETLGPGPQWRTFAPPWRVPA